jgi:1,4-dihydroxy-2-naphthoate octaprenyltransferase
MKTWFLAVRPWSFSMSAISVTIGSVLAWQGDFSWPFYLVTLLAMICLHGAANLTNDYFDVKNGVDTPDVPTANYRPHPLMHKQIDIRLVPWVIGAMYLMGIVLGLYLAAARGWPVLAIGMAGVFTSFAYTAPPINLKYRALGEPLVFLMWGPLAVLGSYFVQAQTLSWDAVLVSLPFGALVALVLLANNVRDSSFDKSKDILTIAVLLGSRAGRFLYGGLMVCAFAGVALMAVLGPLPIWSLMVLAAVPLSVPLFRMVSRGPTLDADAQTAKLDTAFGVLLIASLLLGQLT